jgi:hypothetical protein
MVVLMRFFGCVIIVCISLSLFITPSSAIPSDASPQTSLEQPRLILLLVIDQFPASYIRRFSSFFSGGLKQLISEGVVFENGFHDHGITETCPGHATISTGRFPSVHGVISNHWYERGTKQYRYCAHDLKGNLGPYALKSLTLADQLRSSHPEAKIASISGKDRAAVLLGGRSPDIAAWFSSDTLSFETSSFYDRSREEVASLLDQYSADTFFSKHRGTRWLSSNISDESLAEAEIFPLDGKASLLNRGLFSQEAPFLPRKEIGHEFILTPFLDEYTALVALDAARKLQMGRSPNQTDLLAVSFSAIDYIGHRYGPNSREMLEALIALDITIGRLLLKLESQVGKGYLFVALSSDHGIQPLPEVQQKLGKNVRRITPKDIECISKATSSFPVLAKGSWLSPVSFWLPENSERTRDELARVQKPLDAAIKSCGWVASILYPSPSEQQIEYARKLSAQELTSYHSIHPERSPDIHLIPKEGITPELGNDAVHGSPYFYDTKVPILFWQRGIGAKRLTNSVPTVVIAPVLSKLANIESIKSDAPASAIQFVQAQLKGELK